MSNTFHRVRGRLHRPRAGVRVANSPTTRSRLPNDTHDRTTLRATLHLVKRTEDPTKDRADRLSRTSRNTPRPSQRNGRSSPINAEHQCGRCGRRAASPRASSYHGALSRARCAATCSIAPRKRRGGIAFAADARPPRTPAAVGGVDPVSPRARPCVTKPGRVYDLLSEPARCRGQARDRASSNPPCAPPTTATTRTAHTGTDNRRGTPFRGTIEDASFFCSNKPSHCWHDERQRRHEGEGRNRRRWTVQRRAAAPGWSARDV